MHGQGRLQEDSWEGAQVEPENGEGTREGTAGHSRYDFLPLPESGAQPAPGML